MAAKKYAKYIITEPKTPPASYIKKKDEQKKSGNYIESFRMFGLDNNIAKGAFYTDCVWMMDKKGTGTVESEIAHSHDFDEVLGFIGSVKGNPRELG